MTWTDRLRDIVLAGGAVAAAGCSSSQASPPTPSPEAGAISDSGPPGTKDAPDDAGPGLDGAIETNFCCNADPDPCCAFEHCDASLGTACECSLDGGVFDYGSQSCSIPNGDADAHD